MAISIVKAAEKSNEPLLQMSEMDEAENVALPAISKANQHLMIKGTAGRYGIIDSLVFAFYSAKSRFFVLDPATAKHLAFYQHFNALKSALKTLDRPKIKESYDNLVKTVRSYSSNVEEQKRLDEALLTILNEEFSEKTTNALLHEIRLLEGSQIAMCLQWFITTPNGYIQTAVSANYGTPEQVREDFCLAAAQAAQSETEVEQCITSTDVKVRRFNRENFADAGETNRVLSRLCEYLGNHMISNQPITPELLEGIEEGGIYLVQGLRNLKELAAKLEQIRLQNAGPREERSRKIGLYQEVLKLGRELETLERDILEKRDELSTERTYTPTDVAAFVGEGIDRNVVIGQIMRDQEQFQQLESELKAARSTLNQAIAAEHLSKTDQKTIRMLEAKRQEIHRLKQKYREIKQSNELESLLQAFLTMQDLNNAYDQAVKAGTLSWVKSVIMRLRLLVCQAEFNELLRNIQMEAPGFSVYEDMQDCMRLDREVAELRIKVAAGQDVDKTLIAKLPELKTSVIELGNQLREAVVRIGKGRLLLQMNCRVLDSMLLVVGPSANVSENNPLVRARVAAQAKEGEFKRAQLAFDAKRREYEAAYAVYLDMYKNSPELPKVEDQVRPLNVTANVLVADPSIQEFSAEIVQTVSRQTAPMLKARAKEKYLQSLNMARRICEIKAVEEVQVFQEAVKRMNPLLRKAFSYQIRSAKPNNHQVRKEYCDHLTAQLSTM